MDGVWVDTWPSATASAPYDLYDGDDSGMGRIAVARHGGQVPGQAPRRLPPGSSLPGALDMAYWDGHVAKVKLEMLWQQYWHLNYVPPAVRPQ